MATAVLDIEVTKLPPELTGLEHVRRALILIRLRGRPVGQALLNVVDGRIGTFELHDAVKNDADGTLLEQWIRDFLKWDEKRMVNSALPTVTVAVCTRNRPEDLQRCLDALMKLPDIGQELLVVDNCPSNDEAFNIVKRYSRVRYVCEDRPGLNIARNRALREARQEIVAFTDEGAIPDPSWLNALVSNFDEPSVLCVTGLTMPLELETEAQEWFEQYNSFGRCFRRTVLAIPGANPMAAGRFGAGTNMALRRSVLEQIGPFDEALDAGTPTRSGGDADMFSRILTAGYKMIYDPSALNWYRNRKTREALRQALYDHGVGVASCWTRHLLKGEWGVLKVAWNWVFSYRLKAIARSVLRRSNSIPLDLLSAELRGCAIGPWAYCYSRRLSRERTKDHD